MNIRIRRNQGMAIFAVILMFAAVLIIVGAIVYILVKALRTLDRKINPPPNSETNRVDSVASVVVYMPAFQFGAIPTPPNSTAANPLGSCRLFIQRSTNMVDWVDIAEWTNSYDFDFIQDDPDMPPDKAFYRSRLEYP